MLRLYEWNHLRIPFVTLISLLISVLCQSDSHQPGFNEMTSSSSSNDFTLSIILSYLSLTKGVFVPSSANPANRCLITQKYLKSGEVDLRVSFPKVSPYASIRPPMVGLVVSWVVSFI